jgi:hypothetical protein
MVHKHANGRGPAIPAAHVVNHEILATSHLFDSMAKVLEKGLRDRRHDEKQTLLKGVKILQSRGFDCPQNLEKERTEFLDGMYRVCVSAIRSTIETLQNLFDTVRQVIDTLLHPKKKAQSELDAARCFCATLARELHNQAYGL